MKMKLKTFDFNCHLHLTASPRRAGQPSTLLQHKTPPTPLPPPSPAHHTKAQSCKRERLSSRSWYKLGSLTLSDITPAKSGEICDKNGVCRQFMQSPSFSQKVREIRARKANRARWVKGKYGLLSRQTSSVAGVCSASDPSYVSEVAGSRL